MGNEVTKFTPQEILNMSSDQDVRPVIIQVGLRRWDGANSQWVKYGVGGTIVSGTKTVTTAGTAVRITASSTPCQKVILSADLGNTNPVVVGDSSVVAASGSQRGIVLVPGNDPIVIEIADLNLLWVDAQSNGDKLAYAYIT